MIGALLAWVSAESAGFSHVHLTADDGLNTCVFGRGVKIDDAMHITVVGDGEGVHSLVFGFGDKLRNAAESVK
jgi:hypothetical protein